MGWSKSFVVLLGFWSMILGLWHSEDGHIANSVLH